METYAIDFETTGKDATTAHPIEMAVVSTRTGGACCSLLALPPGEVVPPEASAIHHIIDEDLLGAPTLEDIAGVTKRAYGGAVLVAHNAEYEAAIIDRMWGGQPVRWVCTYKVALVMYPDAPSHSNEGLRYFLRVGDRGRSSGMASHSALHDAQITALLFEHMLAEQRARMEESAEFRAASVSREDVIEWMLQVSREPAKLPTCPIGKERGKKWADVDAGFMSWCLRQPDMREDVKHACREELGRRSRR